jgi:hypothetical protein
MNETCDRCGPAIGAAYRVDRAGELYLCGRCASRHWRALSARGWTFWPLVDRQAYISQSQYVSDRAFGLLCPGEREGGAR